MSMRIFFANPKPLPEGSYFPKPEVFTGEYGRILELSFMGCILALAIYIIIIMVLWMWK